MDGHMGLANSVALMLVGITNLIDDPKGGIVMRTAVGGSNLFPSCVNEWGEFLKNISP